MISLCHRLFYSLVLLIAGAVVSQPLFAQQPDRPRVVIIDASRSMIEKDFKRDTSRWDAAQFQVRAYLQELLTKGDMRPTALIAFGHQQSSVEAMRAHNTNDSRTVSADTKYCRDVEVLAGPAPMNASRIDHFTQLLDLSASKDQGPSGMTPIIQALRAAAGLMEKKVGGEILIVSDWERVNCVPDGQSFCEWVQDVFNEFQAEGGTVELRYIFVDPNRTDVSPPNELQGCAPNDSSSTEDNPRNQGSAKNLANQFDVTFSLDFGGSKPANLPANHLAGSRMTVMGPSIGGRGIRHNGALGTVTLFKGVHDYTARVFPGSDAEKRFSGAHNVTGISDVALPYVAPKLSVTLENHSKQLLKNVGITLAFEYIGNSALNHRPSMPVQTGKLDTVLLPGAYRVTATLGGQSTSKAVTLIEGRDEMLTLVLDAQPITSGGGSATGTPNTTGQNKGGNNSSGTSSTQNTPGTSPDDGLSLTIDLSYTDVDLFQSMARRPRFLLNGKEISTGKSVVSLLPGRHEITITEGPFTGTVPVLVVDEPDQTYQVSPKPGWIFAQERSATRYEIVLAGRSIQETVDGARLHALVPAGDYVVTAWRGNDQIGRDVTVSVTPNKGSPARF